MSSAGMKGLGTEGQTQGVEVHGVYVLCSPQYEVELQQLVD